MSRPDIQLSVGVDIVRTERIQRLVDENAGIENRVFTEREISYCSGKRRRYEHLAARFAAKEAVLKAIGTGLARRMRWTDVEVVRGACGRPYVELGGEVAREAGRRRIARIDVSLSHAHEYAVAQAVAVSSGSAS